ncbi:MAG: ABC transporter substrate-binding protein [Oscillospiraceae bacterium]|nr:ABC transporter substrate-binding protein [Oscillospiraceae bacterium]
MKKLLFFILALSLILSACELSEIENDIIESESETIETHNKSFGVAFASSESMDPYTTKSNLNFELMGLICEPLFSLSETFEAYPVLCESYTYENRTYSFKIRDGVTFSDGSTMTADDVVYSLRAASEQGSFFASRLASVESIRAIGKDTVTVKLRYDNARLPAALDIPIIKSGTRNSFFPIGTGLYFPKDDKSFLVASNSHHSGKTAHYSTIRLTDIGSIDELVFEFDTHNVSILTSDPTGNSPISPMSAAKLTNVPSTRMHYIGFNTRRAPFDDKAARYAVAKAIDRESISVGDFALMGKAAALPVHPASPLYSAEISAVLDYDGNTPLPFDDTLTILVNSENPSKLAACKRIAETLTRLGATTTVRALPFNEYAAALNRGDFTLYYAETTLAPDFDLTKFFSGSLNYGGFYDSSLSSLHTAYLSGDEASGDFFRTFCDTVPFSPIMFKDTAMYTEDGFFKSSAPTSQNVYHNFESWVVS